MNMVKKGICAAIGILASSLPSIAVSAEPVGHITGLGGVFVTSKDGIVRPNAPLISYLVRAAGKRSIAAFCSR